MKYMSDFKEIIGEDGATRTRYLVHETAPMHEHGLLE